MHQSRCARQQKHYTNHRGWYERTSISADDVERAGTEFDPLLLKMPLKLVRQLSLALTKREREDSAMLAYYLLCLLAVYPPVAQSFFVGDMSAFTSAATTFTSFPELNQSGIDVVSTPTSIAAVFNDDYRLLDLFQLLLPDVSKLLGIEKLESDNPLNFKVSNFSYNLASGEWSIGTKPFPTWVIKKNVLAVSNVTAFFGVTIQPKATRGSDKFLFETFGVAGTVWIGSTGLDLKISKIGPNLFFYGAPSTGSIPVGSFVEWLGSKILPDDLQEPLGKIGLDRFTIEQASAVATYGAQGFAFGVSGNPTISGWGGFRCHFLVTRYAARSYQTARTVFTFAINIPSFSLAGLVSRLTDGAVDISEIPVIGNLTVPETGLVVSSGHVIPNMLPYVLDGILSYTMPITKGVSLVAAIPFVSGQPPVLFILKIGPGGVRFTIRDTGRSLTVGNLINALVPDFNINDIPLPPGISDILNIQMTRFKLTSKPKSLAVEFRANSDINIIPGFVSVVDPSLYVNITFSKPRKIRFKAGGFLQFGSIDFDVTIEQAAKGTGFIITAQGPVIDIGAIIGKFNADFLPAELSAILKKASMIDFKILEPRLSVPVGTGASGFVVQLSGQPQIAGWAGVRLSCAIAKTDTGTAMAGGFEFANIGFASVIQKLTGIDVSFLKLLDRSLKVAVVISSKTMPGVKLHGDVLNKIAIRRGLSLIALFSFPADCEGDGFCKFCKQTLGPDASLQLSVTISSITQFVIAASINNIQLGGGIELSRCALEFGIGTETYIGISATLALSNPPLKFTGELRAGTDGVTITMLMQGIWKRAFWIDYLAFGNGIISATLKPSLPFLTGLELGGEVWLGRIDSGNEIKIRVYVGIDVLNPSEIYFYGSVNQLTMAAIMRAFDFNVPLPPVLANSGFPEGLLISYSSTARELRPSGITIPQGIVINGTLDILGFRLKVYIDVGLPRGIKLNIRMTPLNIAGGLIKLYKSRSDSSNGPMLVADVKLLPLPSINVAASGYVSFLYGMIEREVHLQITNSQFLFYIRGRFFLFDSILKIYAPYGSLEKASFQIFGRLLGQWFRKIQERVVSIIKSGADAATQRISRAQAKVSSAQSKLNSAIWKLGRARYQVSRLCRTRYCRRWCVGCPSWNRCCRRFWGKCIGCPRWNSCCWTTPDVICEAANAACRLSRRIAYAALWVAERLYRSARSILYFANKALDAVKYAVRVGASAASAITRFALGGLIRIYIIDFNIKVGLVESGNFGGRIKVSFLRRRSVSIKFQLRLKSVREMALDLADAIFPGISGRRRRDVAERLRRNMPDYSHRHYMPDQYIRRPGTDEKAGERRQKFAQTNPTYFADSSVWLRSRRDAVYDVERDMMTAMAHTETLKEQLIASSNESAIPEVTDDEEPEIVTVDASEEIISDADRCERFGRLELFMRRLPEAILTASEEFGHSNSSYKTTCEEYTRDFREAEQYRFEAMNQSQTAQETLHDLLENYENSSPPSNVSVMSQEENIELEMNITGEIESGNMNMMYDKVKEDLDLWSSTAERRLKEQNSRGMESIMALYQRDIENRTGLTLDVYVSDLVNQLSVMYEGVEPDDVKFQNATEIVNSLKTIKNNVLRMLTLSLEEAKELSQATLEEFNLVEETMVFCQP